MKLPFDKVYMLHLAENENRLNFMVNQFKHHGISKQVEIWWTCKRDISIEIRNNIKTLHTNHYDWYQGKKKKKNVIPRNKRNRCQNQHNNLHNDTCVQN